MTYFSLKYLILIKRAYNISTWINVMNKLLLLIHLFNTFNCFFKYSILRTKIQFSKNISQQIIA